MMTADEYEQVVRDIVEQVRNAAPELSDARLHFGRRNRVIGVSGYKHQIDVTLETDSHFYLIECKKWNVRVGLEAVLVLASRVNDVQQSRLGKPVRGILASTKGMSKYAQKLAVAFDLDTEIVSSASEFGMRIGKRIHIGVNRPEFIGGRLV